VHIVGICLAASWIAPKQAPAADADPKARRTRQDNLLLVTPPADAAIGAQVVPHGVVPETAGDRVARRAIGKALVVGENGVVNFTHAGTTCSLVLVSAQEQHVSAGVAPVNAKIV
jgi:hypothetical protein